MTFTEFILAHGEDDPVRLLLSRKRYPEIDLSLAVSTIEARRQLKAKIPEWHAVPSLWFPSRLCAEQCSSSVTARFKGDIAAGLRRIADLTGGLGVDSWAFSKVAGEVLYNEKDTRLYEAVRHNFKELGIDNVRFENKCLEKGKVADILGDFVPDLIYMDPARRASDGRKVFLLEDCSPDVVPLLPEMFDICRLVFLKLSPMADISLLTKQLPHIRDIYIVAVGGECKELLFLLDREWTAPEVVTIVENGEKLILPFCKNAVKYVEGEDDPLLSAGSYLFEPGHALAKSGEFSYPCVYPVKKLAHSTHLYVSDGIVRPLSPYGKWFRIEAVHHLDKRSIKEVGEAYPRAEVSTRNVPLSSDELRRRLGCTSGGNIHIFAAATSSGRVLIVCKKLV